MKKITDYLGKVHYLSLSQVVMASEMDACDPDVKFAQIFEDGRFREIRKGDKIYCVYPMTGKVLFLTDKEWERIEHGNDVYLKEAKTPLNENSSPVMKALSKKK